MAVLFSLQTDLDHTPLLALIQGYISLKSHYIAFLKQMTILILNSLPLT